MHSAVDLGGIDDGGIAALNLDLRVVRGGSRCNQDADQIAGICRLDVGAGSAVLFGRAVWAVGLVEDALHIALAGVKVHADGLLGHAPGLQLGLNQDAGAHGAQVGDLEVVGVVVDARGVVIAVDAEGNHVILALAGIGHGGNDNIVQLRLVVADEVIRNRLFLADLDLVQAGVGDVDRVVGIGDVFADHHDGVRLREELRLDVDAAVGHGEDIAVDFTVRVLIPLSQRDLRAVVLAGDVQVLGEGAVKSVGGVIKHVVITRVELDDHLIVGLGAADGLEVHTADIAHRAHALDRGLGQSDLALGEVDLDGNRGIVSQLEEVVGLELVHVLSALCTGIDLDLLEGDVRRAAVADADVVADIGACGALHIGAADIGSDLVGGCGAGSADTHIGAQQQILGGDLRIVKVEIHGDGHVFLADENRRDGDAAGGHHELVRAHSDLVAVLVADDGPVFDFVAVERLSHQRDFHTGIGLGGGIVRRGLGVCRAALGGHDHNVVALLAELDDHVHVKGGHGEGVVEDGDHLGGIIMLGDLDAGNGIALQRLGHDLDLGALGGLVHLAVVDREEEAAHADGGEIGDIGDAVDIEVEGADGLERDLDGDSRLRHCKAVVGDGQIFLCAQHGAVVGGDRLDLVGGVGADDHDLGVAGGGGDTQAAHSGDSLAGVVGLQGDGVAGLDVRHNADVGFGHDEGVAGQQQVGLAVGVLHSQLFDCLAVVGGDNHVHLVAGFGGGNGLVVHIEGHGAVDAVHLSGQLVDLGSAGAGRTGAAGRAGAAGRTGAAGAGRRRLGRDDEVDRVEQSLSGFELVEVLGVVQRAQHIRIVAVADADIGADGVCSLTGQHVVYIHCLAGGAHGGLVQSREQIGAAGSDRIQILQAVDFLDDLAVNAQVAVGREPHCGADAEDGLTAAHGVGHQIVRQYIVVLRGGRCGRGGRRGRRGGQRGGSRRRAGRGSAAQERHRVHVGRRQKDFSADCQEAPLFLSNVVESHDGVLAHIEVETQPLADSQHIVTLHQRVTDGVVGGIVCIRADGQPREQGHDHQYREQHTYEPFLHSCSP